MKEIIGTLLIFLIYFIMILTLMLYGTYITFRDLEIINCKETAIWNISIITIIIFWLFVIGFILFLFSIGIMRCIRNETDLELAIKETNLEKLEREKAAIDAQILEMANLEAKRELLIKQKKAINKDINDQLAAEKKEMEEIKKKQEEEKKKQEKIKRDNEEKLKEEERKRELARIEEDRVKEEMKKLEEDLEQRKKVIEDRKHLLS